MLSRDVAYWSASRLVGAIQKGDISAQDALEGFLSRLEDHNTAVNALITFDIDTARQRARDADAARARGETLRPLHGVPMTVKESFNVMGMPTTWGLAEHRDNIPASNAKAVERLVNAGANIFAKSNVPAFLADWETFNEVYGTTSNPWDLKRSPGGSSGGAAAALAAGLTSLELGSDIGGSIRNPAHYCGVYGHKPTYGIVSPQGHALPGRVSLADISVIGPLARSTDDLKLAMSIIAGPDDIDGRGWQLNLKPPVKTQWRDFRIAVVLSDPVAEVTSEIQESIQALADFAANKGAHVNNRARPNIEMAEIDALYISLLRAATSSRQSDEAFALNRQRAETLPLDDQSYFARMARGNTLSHRGWLAANERRHQLRLEWARFFENYDILLCPAAATTAMKHDQQGERYERRIQVNDSEQPPTTQMFWSGYSGVAYLPSTVAPIGLGQGQLPIGVQIVGPQYDDLTCIQFAALIERDFHAFAPPPKYV